jgi:hypothetical protein
MRGAEIVSTGDHYADVPDDASAPDLKPLVKEATGQPVRRVGRFIQLALIGAGRCIGARTLAPDTGVYFTSGRGDMEVTSEVMHAIVRDGEAPKPLHFINTVSNAACFYVAKHFGLGGRSTFLCNRYAGFEAALDLALLDLETGCVSEALVGSVDIVVPPLAIHRRRLHLDADTPVAEASHWLLLRRASGAGAIVEISRIFGDADAAAAWISARDLDADTPVATGQFMTPDALETIVARCGLSRRFAYREGRAHYDTQSGAAATAFAASRERALLHLNASPDGQIAAMLFRRA